MISGSIENGQIDTEYTVDPDHRQSAQELWFRACDKRISSLELAVHRLLNTQHSEDASEQYGYSQGYADGKAAVTRTEGDYVHVPGAIWEDMIDELAAARSPRPVMDENGVLLSHDAYDMMEREAAIGRSVPWKGINQPLWTEEVQAWYKAHAPKDTDATAHEWNIKTGAAE